MNQIHQRLLPTMPIYVLFFQNIQARLSAVITNMKNKIFSLSIIILYLLSGSNILADTYVAKHETTIYFSYGATYLARLESPLSQVGADNFFPVPIELFKYDEESHAYLKTDSFNITGMSYPQKILITDNGKYVIAITYVVSW